MTAPLTPEREADYRLRAESGFVFEGGEVLRVFSALDHARTELAAAEARGREAGLREAAAVAYKVPEYINSFEPDELGRLQPGSPYDRGRYDAANAILSLIGTPPPPQGGSDGIGTPPSVASERVQDAAEKLLPRSMETARNVLNRFRAKPEGGSDGR